LSFNSDHDRAKCAEQSSILLQFCWRQIAALLLAAQSLKHKATSSGGPMKCFYAALACILLTSPAFAQQQPRDQVARANQGTIGVITGMEGGTYARTGADLTILDDGVLRVLPTIGKGSLQNLSDILYLKGVDIGFVQADALTYAQQRGLLPNLTQSIRYIAKLYDEEVHVLVRKDISRLEDLNGQRVNVDVTGSGSAMTADILLEALGIKAKVEHEKQVNGLQALKMGEIAAIIHVGGAPIPLLADVSGESGIHFLPVPLTPTLAQTYLPDRFTHDTYPLLVQADAPVPTIAVGDVMAVFAWQPNTERYGKVARFVDAFFSKFDQFQQPPRHPKWREVNLTAEVPGWTRFQPAQEWLARRAVSAATPGGSQAPRNTPATHPGGEAGATLAKASKAAPYQPPLNEAQQQPAAR
jgi:TRAP transporter TAXI family solute receptor